MVSFVSLNLPNGNSYDLLKIYGHRMTYLIKYLKLRKLDIICRAKLSSRYIKEERPSTHVYTFLEKRVDRMVVVLSVIMIISFFAGPMI